jgi:adenine phosphoribosyltransferase
MSHLKSLHTTLIEQIRFFDGHAEIWRVFEDNGLFRDVVDALAAPWESLQPTKTAGIEGRGFILPSSMSGVTEAGRLRRPGG